MRNLIIAWATTLSLLGAGITWAEMTYVPMPIPQSQTTLNDTGFDADGNPRNNIESSTETSITAEAPAIANEPTNNPNPDEPVGENTTKGEIPENKANTDPADETIQAQPTGFQNTYIIANSDTELAEEGPYGGLPIIKNQRQPWQVYSRPFEKSRDRPRIAIIISSIGFNGRMTQAAIDELPPEITLALSPYANAIEGWTDGIRQSGHEMLLMVPMEPLDYPLNDPGPHTLMTSLSANENLDRLYWLLSQTSGYVGIINEMGSKFTADPDSIRPIMQDIQRRGIAFVDSRTTRFTLGAISAQEFGIPTAINSRYIDNDLSAAQIDRYLRELENTAQRSGFAVGIGRANPVTYKRLIEWAQTLDAKGIDLAPITAIINHQEIQ